MSESIKATRATVAIGALTVDAFMLPDGSYRMSQAGAASAIADSPVYALHFLKINDSKLLLGEAFTDYSPDVIANKTVSILMSCQLAIANAQKTLLFHTLKIKVDKG